MRYLLLVDKESRDSPRFARPDEVLNKVGPVVLNFEKMKEGETVESLFTRAMKNNNAVLGLKNVLNALQEQRVMKLVFIKDYRASGYSHRSCGYLSVQRVEHCPYCGGEIDTVDYIVDLAGEMTIQQSDVVEAVTENKKLSDTGGIGAFLRF